MEIPELLVAAREAAGLTQAVVAAARHVSRGAQSQLELAGARPAWDTIDSFARAIDASVILTFELANGEVVSGRCAGVHRPTLADDLYADAESARRYATATGLARTKGLSAPKPVIGEFATVTRLVEIIEPSNWVLQRSLQVLMSMAVAERVERGTGSHFSQRFGSLICPFPEDEERQPVYNVTEQSQIALAALLDATRFVAGLALDHPSFAARTGDGLPVRGLTSYLASNSPGATEVAALMKRISLDEGWRLTILRTAGYLHGVPSPHKSLPHTVLEVD